MSTRLIATLLIWVGITVHACGAQALLFSRRDPALDDFGAGSLAYPLDASFTPGVFDLTHFSVVADETHYYFRFEFAQLDNPWNAPEGFYHPRIDVYMDTTPGVGLTHPLRPGPGEIRFAEAHPWDVWLRIAPWDGAAVLFHDDPPTAEGRTGGTHLRVLGERTIEALIPKQFLPALDNARYYVLVGSFDALGIDGYRMVEEVPSQWLLSDETTHVRIIDILAPHYGRSSQRRQLKPDATTGVVRLYPVGRGARRGLWVGVLLLTTTVAMVSMWAYRRRT